MKQQFPFNCIKRVLSSAPKSGGKNPLPIGGENMYSYTNFKSNGIRLGFLKTNNISYRQFGDMFKNNLSIIDVLMFNSKLELPKLIQNYCLIGENDK